MTLWLHTLVVLACKLGLTGSSYIENVCRHLCAKTGGCESFKQEIFTVACHRQTIRKQRRETVDDQDTMMNPSTPEIVTEIKCTLYGLDTKTLWNPRCQIGKPNRIKKTLNAGCTYRRVAVTNDSKSVYNCSGNRGVHVCMVKGESGKTKKRRGNVRQTKVGRGSEVKTTPEVKGRGGVEDKNVKNHNLHRKQHMKTNMSVISQNNMEPGALNKKKEIIINRIRQGTELEDKTSTTQAVTNVRKKKRPKGYKKMTAGQAEIYVKTYSTTKTWEEALKTCRSDGGTLLQIDTRDKQRAVKILFRPYWIGLKDVYDNDTFFWTDGSRVTYSRWQKEQPSLITNDGKKENCVELSVHVFKGVGWDDEPCDQLNMFFCEL